MNIYFDSHSGSILCDMLQESPYEQCGLRLCNKKSNNPEVYSDKTLYCEYLILQACNDNNPSRVVLLNALECLSPLRLQSLYKNICNAISNCKLFLVGPCETAVYEAFFGYSTEYECSELIPLMKRINHPLKVFMNADHLFQTTNNENIHSSLHEICPKDSIYIDLNRGDDTNNHNPNQWLVFAREIKTVQKLKDKIINKMNETGNNHITILGDPKKAKAFKTYHEFVQFIYDLYNSLKTIHVNMTCSFEIINQILDSGDKEKLLIKEYSPSDIDSIDTLYRIYHFCRVQDIKLSIPANVLCTINNWEGFRQFWNICDEMGDDFFIRLIHLQKFLACNRVKEILNDVLPQEILYEYQRIKSHIYLARNHVFKNRLIHHSYYDYIEERLYCIKNMLLHCLSLQGVYLQKSQKPSISEHQELINEITELGRFNEKLLTEYSEDRHIISVNSSNKKTAVITTCCNNNEYIRLCLNSMSQNTNHPYDLFIIDYGNNTLSELNSFNINGTIKHKRISKRQNSLAMAHGIELAIDYDYVLLMSSNMVALEPDWLQDLIDEFEHDPAIGASGICLYGLNINDEAGQLLYNYVTHPRWSRELGCSENVSKEDISKRICYQDQGEQRLIELTGMLQVYKGDILRKVGMPIVNHVRLKHMHWDSELSMRVLMTDYKLHHSKVIENKMHYFGPKENSGFIPNYYSYQLKENRQWLIDEGHEDLANYLESDVCIAI